MDAEKLLEAINTAKQAVDKSDFGPLITIGHTEDLHVRKNVNPVAFQVFAVVLAEVIKQIPHRKSDSSFNHN